MLVERAENKRGRFRRVSKARIFDGHPIKTNFHAISVMVFSYLVITVMISLMFAYVHKVEFSLVLWALLPGSVLGYVLLIVERSLGQLKDYVFPRMGKLLTAFMLFFVHAIGYLALSSLIVSYPLGYMMERTWGMPGMATEYSLFSVNFFILLALLSWLRNVRTPPSRCF